MNDRFAIVIALNINEKNAACSNIEEVSYPVNS